MAVAIPATGSNGHSLPRPLQHVPEKLRGFFHKDMLQLFEFERSTPEYGKQNDNGDWHT
jgi:hypothetical protein